MTDLIQSTLILILAVQVLYLTVKIKRKKDDELRWIFFKA